MASSASDRKVSFANLPYEDEEEFGDLESTELNDLWPKGQSSLDSGDKPIGRRRSKSTFKLWRRGKRGTYSGNALRRIRGTRFNGFAAGRFRILWRILKALIIFISGIIVTILVVPNVDYWPGPDSLDQAFGPFDPWISSTNYPDEYFRSILPIPCHSHNDYWRRRPLWSALCTGCISVEADVWLFNDELYVGHAEGELEENRTLSKMYIDPLVELLEQRNKPTGLAAVFPSQTRSRLHGVFFQDPEQSLTLLIDFKTEGSALWPAVERALEPLRGRDWLTFWDGHSRMSRPVTVVGTGNTPFDVVVANMTYRDIFFDAPLEALSAPEDQVTQDSLDVGDGPAADPVVHSYKYNPSNSHYASSSMTRALGPLWHYALSESQLGLMRTQIEQARARGLVPRYWGTPRWPVTLRDSIWELLIKEDAGVLNVDDLRAARKGTWGTWLQPGADVNMA